MKQTVLFSNVIGNIYDPTDDCSFNANLTKVLKEAISGDENLVFINAPGFKNDDLYFSQMIKCFEKIGISFKNKIEISNDSKIDEFKSFPKNRVYFLMGGNPLTQFELIKKYDLTGELKNYNGVVIGFCAGAINLSKHSIITTDDEFDTPLSYDGIGRVDISVEPHFYLDNSAFTKNRLKEIKEFCEKLKTNIYAIPDLSVINIIDDKIEFLGEIYNIIKE